MVIEIHIPNPRAALLALAVGAGVFLWAGGVDMIRGEQQQYSVQASVTAPAGGPEEHAVFAMQEAEREVKQSRQERALLERKEEILRYQLRAIESALAIAQTAEQQDIVEELLQSRQELIALLRDQRATEQHLLASLHQLWEAEAQAGRIAGTVSGVPIALQWPIEPIYGISAGFLDEEYEQIFGMPHHAIDIPALQGTEVRAAADGIVEKVADNGYGYNYMILRHAGVVTLYGHTESFLVAEGDQVRAGDPIALSGGRPGSKGAGSMTTGPHLHFETIVNGEHVDPQTFLSSK